jgi:L-lactate utilization protein LutB
MIDQHERVRASFTCVRCGGCKPQGLLLCWQCHHGEKVANSGYYSPAVEAKAPLPRGNDRKELP